MRRVALCRGRAASRKTALTLVVVSVFLPGCDEAIQDPYVSPPPPPTAYVVFGTVRDQAGSPLALARADIVEGTYAGVTAETNAQGHFRFIGVSGRMRIVAWKEGYDFHQQVVDVIGDQPIEFQLSRFESEGLIFGRTIRAFVRAGSTPCDPQRWDARAPCRPFRFTPPYSGLLSIRIDWLGQPQLDATLIGPSGVYVATSADAGSEAVTLDAFVEVGVTYELRVNS
ncbi:MAG: carboxypeptidase-like regulatory domain-containing protein [Longimicrobiales bacterium]